LKQWHISWADDAKHNSKAELRCFSDYLELVNMMSCQ